MRGRLLILIYTGLRIGISIHAPMRGRLSLAATTYDLRGFQSTPPCGGDLSVCPGLSSLQQFQSTPPCGGDRQQTDLLPSRPDFNPRPHAGATWGTKLEPLIARFQSTPPCGGDGASDQGGSATDYFNPRPHAGATTADMLAMIFGRISIHAPMRGRLPRRTLQDWESGFQSTPPCGGDCLSFHASSLTYHFNPRPHAGATWKEVPRCQEDIDISIHAPMRGRRSPGSVHLQGGRFQSTPPCGGDPSCHLQVVEAGNFNPRPHAGATTARRQPTPLRPDFNPRPHAGATNRTAADPHVGHISIHAPMRGRRVPKRKDRNLPYFNPRPHAGATPWLLSSWPSARNFNPRPHAGATFRPILGFIAQAGFQSTPPCGGDDQGLKPFSAALISIHAPMRGRPLRMRHSRVLRRFQSTPPCGGDDAADGENLLQGHFNPRPHAGATIRYLGHYPSLDISIHAPMRGRRVRIFCCLFPGWISIHAPMRGRLYPLE